MIGSQRRPLSDWETEAIPFSVTVTRDRAGRALAVVAGDIDALTLERLDRDLAAVPDSDTMAVVVDLSRVPFCSAGGLGLLLNLLDRTHRASIPLKLVVGTHDVHRLLTSMHAAEEFSIHTYRTSALATVDG